MRSIKEESLSLSRVVVLGELHRWLLVCEYALHYPHERSTRGRVIVCYQNHHLSRTQTHRRVCGLLNYYHREAA